MATAKKKAPAKKAASKQPNPPSPAKAAGKAAGAKMSKETSAVTRAKAAAYKKSGAEYMKTGSKSMSGDLGGPNWQQVKGFKYGSPEFRRSRTEQRALDQDKRAKTKSGKGYLRKGPDTFSSPAYLSKANDLAGVEPFGIGKNKMGRTAKRGIDQAKRKKK
jgi:hypothetical protein